MTVLEADQKGLTWREIAVLLWGAERVAEDWWPGGLDARPCQAPPRQGPRHAEGIPRYRRGAAMTVIGPALRHVPGFEFRRDSR